ncbi:hypothetical protein L3Q82_014627, partial [Scortum barcoo]
RLKENIITFVKTELKKFQGVLSPDYPECFERLERDEEGVHGGEDEQRKSSRQALLKITLHFLRRMKQEELADCLQNNEKVRKYFRKRFRDEEQASRIISHIKTSRSLHIMCHIPVFCWITASVLEDRTASQTREELPKSLTEMYIHFLVVQSKVGNVKYCGGAETDPLWKTEASKIIMSLGKLAFEHLQKGNLILYESDLRECDIDIRAASVYSGVFTQIFKQDSELYQEKAFCFVHLSIQEFLAALYVFVTFINTGANLLSESRARSKWSLMLRDKSMVNQLYQSAMDKTIQSPNGHLDLFLRFLLGFSLETNQTLLQELLTPLTSNLKNHQETVKYIKKKVRRNPSPEKCITSVPLPE